MKPIRQWPAILPALLLFILSSVILIPACKKEQPQSVVEISEVKTGGNVKAYNFEFSNNSETLNVLTIKNTVGSGVVHVKLAKDPTATMPPNTRLLPESNYSLGPLEFDVNPNSSVSFPLTVMNKHLRNVDSFYAVPLKIEAVTGGTIAPDAKSMVVVVDLRNRLDGKYRVTGTMVDIAAPTLTGYFPQDVHLITTGANSVTMIPLDLGIPGHLILSGTSLSYYGSFGPVFTFDKSSFKILAVTNSYGQPASNTRSADIDPSGTNQWNSSTKNMSIKYYQKQPNTVTTSPYIRVYFNEVFTYLGSRY